MAEDEDVISRKADLADCLKSLADLINQGGYIVIVHGCDSTHGQRVRDLIRRNEEIRNSLGSFQSKAKDGTYDVYILPENGFSRIKHEFDLRDKEYVNWGDMMSPSNVIWRTRALIPKSRYRASIQPTKQYFAYGVTLESSLMSVARSLEVRRGYLELKKQDYSYVMAVPIRTKFASEHRGMTFIFDYIRLEELDSSLLWEVTGRF